MQLTILPLYFISGIWFTTDELPNALQKVAEYLPVEPLAHQLHLALLDPHIDGSDLATLAGGAGGGGRADRVAPLHVAPRAAVTA